jgi:hypothetical protein
MPCLIVAIGVGVVLLARWSGVAVRGSPPQKATLLFLGPTNLPAGSYAVFCLTNETKTPLACVPEAVEQASTNGWMRTSLNGTGGRGMRDWIGVPEELKPGQGFTFLVPSPDSNGTWRLVFMCQEQARLIDPVTDTVRHLTDTNAMQSKIRQFSGRRYYVTSPEVRPAEGTVPNSR